jgi:hypothetical protein
MKTIYIELIQKEIDGLITPAEKKILVDALGRDPELSQLHKELRYTAEILKKVPAVEPTPELKKKIIQAIDFSRYTPKAESMAWLSRLTNWITTPPLRLAYATAAGIVLGFLISLLVIKNPSSYQPIPLSELYGTIGISDKNFITLNEFTINQEGINGFVKVNSYQDMVWIEVNVIADQSTEIHFSYDDQRLSLQGLRPIESGRTLLETEQNLIKILFDQQCHCLVLFRKSVENFYPFILNMMQSGKTIFIKNFSAGD